MNTNNYQSDNRNNDTLLTGRVCEVQKNSFCIMYNGEEYPARLRGRFYAEDEADFPLVGDFVEFELNPYGESMIFAVCERETLLRRPDQARTGVMQHMVANADYAFIVTSLNEDYSYNRIARYTSVVLEAGVIPVVILTKSDLCPDVDTYVDEVKSISDKIRVHALSALYGTGLEELREYMLPENTICLIGSSGAGKSTLINALAGKEVMKTGTIRESDSTGKHTTTYRRLFVLDNGVTFIDTPGMREIGIADSQDGVDDTFEDIVELESCCKFSNCRHETEPGCAIKAAIESGELSAERYYLYKGLSAENTRNYAKKKEISKWHKAMKKAGLI